MSDYFLDDFGQGIESGLGIAGKLQSISQSRQEFELKKHSIEQQQQQIDDQLGLQQDVGMMLASGKFSATDLYRKHPRAYKEIQQLQAEQAHLVSAKAAIPSAQIIQAIQSGDINGAAQVIQGNAETIDKVMGYPGAHQAMIEQLKTNPADVLERARKSYILAKGDPKAEGMGNTFDPKAQAQIQKLDDNYSGKIDKLQQSTDATSGAIQSLDTIIGQLDKASKNPSLSDSAGFRSLSVHVPGSDAKDFQEQLSPVMAQSYISAINQAKAAGGGSLRISQQEIQTLAKGLGSLDIGQSDKQLSSNIKNILTQFKVQRAKLMKHNQESQAKLQAANQQYNMFQQQAGTGGDPILQDASQPAQAPQAPTAPASPMQDQTQPQQPQMQPQAQSGKAPQAALDYLAQNPNTLQDFISHYGYNPNTGG